MNRPNCQSFDLAIGARLFDIDFYAVQERKGNFGGCLCIMRFSVFLRGQPHVLFEKL